MIDKILEIKKIIITGHTGFKGTWLTLWLQTMGAKVLGISKNIPTKPSHFENIDLKKKIKGLNIDICDYKKISKSLYELSTRFCISSGRTILGKKSYLNPIKLFNQILLEL